VAWLKNRGERLLNTRGFQGKGLLFPLYFVLQTANRSLPLARRFSRTRFAPERCGHEGLLTSCKQRSWKSQLTHSGSDRLMSLILVGSAALIIEAGASFDSTDQGITPARTGGWAGADLRIRLNSSARLIRKRVSRGSMTSSILNTCAAWNAPEHF